MTVVKRFSRQPGHWILIEMMALLFAIAVLDFLTSYNIRLLPFYAGPIFVVGWFCGRRLGLEVALLSGILWWSVNWFNGDPELRNWLAVWETGRHFGFFFVTAWAASALRVNADIAAARIALLEHSQRLENEIVNISELEQQRIGQDLHDGICQQLAALSCSAMSLRDDLEQLRLQKEAQRAGDLGQLLRDTTAQTRDLARELVPAHVADVGLVVALESLAQIVSRLHGISCRFESDRSAIHCDDRTATHLYRVAQEAISNAIRHGRARTIVISLQSAGAVVTLRVSDDGVGINATAGTQGMGLKLMRYRARAAGGELAVERGSNGGTTVSCTARSEAWKDEAASI